jgi:hypothetical protein
MSIVISYAHEDSDFVNRLAANLFKNRVPVWVDRWELRVGDSILRRIESAIGEADALIVVLSKASVQSEWCRKELTAGLLTELEAKSVFVLPIVIEDCNIPLFLKDKLYADFRKDKDKALKDLLEATARFTSDTLYRGKTPKMNTDYGLYYLVRPDAVEINLTLLDMPVDQPYSVITEIYIIGNQAVAKRYNEFAKHGFDWFQKGVILAMVLEAVEKNKSGFHYLESSLPESREFTVADSKRGVRLDVLVQSRRLGEDTGKDIVVDWGLSFKRYVERLLRERDKMPAESKTKLAALINSED